MRSDSVVSLECSRRVSWRELSLLIIVQVTILADPPGTFSRIKQAGIRNAIGRRPSPRHGLASVRKGGRNSSSRRKSSPDNEARTSWFELMRVVAVPIISDEQARAGIAAGVQQKETTELLTQTVQALT